jgi:hypothetical protein
MTQLVCLRKSAKTRIAILDGAQKIRPCIILVQKRSSSSLDWRVNALQWGASDLLMWHGACESNKAKANFKFPNTFIFQIGANQCSIDDIILKPWRLQQRWSRVHC